MSRDVGATAGDNSHIVHAEDLTPGQVMQLGSHAVRESEIIDFAMQWDPQFFHVDTARAAAESQFGGLIASGLHTLSIYQRLWVNSRTQPWRVIAGATMSDVAFLRPVRPGDVLTGHTVIDDVHFEPDKHRGRVTFAGALSNQHDKRVLRVTTSVYLGARTA
ncbi:MULTISPECIES: MaoC/PaaZ C-terminal domain-containing protein [Nocardioides]|uniref:MaoC/PaaZ C-terminal domain-containing protein n=1 Tax=Nocardioides TaxID=1839 RepID=UPI0030F504AD